MFKDAIKELIKTLKDKDTNDLEFRKSLAVFAPNQEIAMFLKDENIGAEELVEMLGTYIK